MYEPLDFINERYSICEDGSIYDTQTQEFVDMILLDGGVTCELLGSDGILRTYQPAQLVAEMFLSNPHNHRTVAFKDGNPLNIALDNLDWCSSRKDYSPRHLNAEQRKRLRLAIGIAIDNGDWEKARKLGNELDPMEDLRTRHMPTDYQSLNVNEKIPVQFSVILEATDINGNHLAYGTANELATIFGVKMTTLRKCYSKGVSTSDSLLFNIVALVPKNMANAIVEVYRDGEVINEGSYTRICLEYNIHFEDLSDLLYTNVGDKITYNGLEFKMKAGQKKIPVDFTEEG